jgi:hypothetical protein
VLRVAGVLLCAAGPLACGLADLLAPAGPQSVQIFWQGDSALSAGDTVPLSIAVTAGGTPVERPHLRITILSPAILAFTSAADSLVALKSGNGQVRVRFENTLLGSAGPDSVFKIRVTGGP